MGFFKKNSGGSGPVDPSLPDDRWWAASETRFRDTVDPYYGTPDTMADGGHDRYANQDFGAALFFFAKSIDMLQTSYSNVPMSRRPSIDDQAITSGFVSALGASLSLHPTAPVQEVATKVQANLEDIARCCSREGHPEGLYTAAASEIGQTLR